MRLSFASDKKATTQPKNTGIAKSLKKLFSNIVPGKHITYTAEDSTVVPTAKYSEQELKDLGATLYGEANPNIDEMRAIASIVRNRAEATGKNLSDIVTAKNQFYGYYNKQADKYRANDLDFMGKNKAKLVQQVLDEISSGMLKDPTGGAYYFDHTNGKFAYDNKRPLIAQ